MSTSHERIKALNELAQYTGDSNSDRLERLKKIEQLRLQGYQKLRTLSSNKFGTTSSPTRRSYSSFSPETSPSFYGSLGRIDHLEGVKPKSYSTQSFQYQTESQSRKTRSSSLSDEEGDYRPRHLLRSRSATTVSDAALSASQPEGDQNMSYPVESNDYWKDDSCSEEDENIEDFKRSLFGDISSFTNKTSPRTDGTLQAFSLSRAWSSGGADYEDPTEEKGNQEETMKDDGGDVGMFPSYDKEFQEMNYGETFENPHSYGSTIRKSYSRDRTRQPLLRSFSSQQESIPGSGPASFNDRNFSRLDSTQERLSSFGSDRISLDKERDQRIDRLFSPSVNESSTLSSDRHRLYGRDSYRLRETYSSQRGDWTTRNSSLSGSSFQPKKVGLSAETEKKLDELFSTPSVLTSNRPSFATRRQKSDSKRNIVITRRRNDQDHTGRVPDVLSTKMLDNKSDQTEISKVPGTRNIYNPSSLDQKLDSLFGTPYNPSTQTLDRSQNYDSSDSHWSEETNTRNNSGQSTLDEKLDRLFGSSDVLSTRAMNYETMQNRIPTRQTLSNKEKPTMSSMLYGTDNNRTEPGEITRTKRQMREVHKTVPEIRGRRHQDQQQQYSHQDYTNGEGSVNGYEMDLESSPDDPVDGTVSVGNGNMDMNEQDNRVTEENIEFLDQVLTEADGAAHSEENFAEEEDVGTEENDFHGDVVWSKQKEQLKNNSLKESETSDKQADTKKSKTKSKGKKSKGKQGQKKVETATEIKRESPKPVLETDIDWPLEDQQNGENEYNGSNRSAVKSSEDLEVMEDICIGNNTEEVSNVQAENKEEVSNVQAENKEEVSNVQAENEEEESYLEAEEDTEVYMQVEEGDQYQNPAQTLIQDTSIDEETHVESETNAKKGLNSESQEVGKSPENTSWLFSKFNSLIHGFSADTCEDKSRSDIPQNPENIEKSAGRDGVSMSNGDLNVVTFSDTGTASEDDYATASDDDTTKVDIPYNKTQNKQRVLDSNNKNEKNNTGTSDDSDTMDIFSELAASTGMPLDNSEKSSVNTEAEALYKREENLLRCEKEGTLVQIVNNGQEVDVEHHEVCVQREESEFLQGKIDKVKETDLKYEENNNKSDQHFMKETIPTLDKFVQMNDKQAVCTTEMSIQTEIEAYLTTEKVTASVQTVPLKVDMWTQTDTELGKDCREFGIQAAPTTADYSTQYDVDVKENGIQVVNKHEQFEQDQLKKENVSDIVKSEIGKEGYLSTEGLSSEREKSNHLSSEQEKLEHLSSEREKSNHLSSGQEKLEHLSSEWEKSNHLSSEQEKLEHLSPEREKSNHLSSGQEKLEHLSSEREKSNHLSSEQVKLEHLSSEQVKLDHLSYEQEKSEHLSSEQVKLDHLSSEQVKLDQEKLEHLSSEQVKLDHLSYEQGKSECMKVETVNPVLIVTDKLIAEYAVAEEIKVEKVVPEQVRLGGGQTLGTSEGNAVCESSDQVKKELTTRGDNSTGVTAEAEVTLSTVALQKTSVTGETKITQSVENDTNASETGNSWSNIIAVPSEISFSSHSLGKKVPPQPCPKRRTKQRPSSRPSSIVSEGDGFDFHVSGQNTTNLESSSFNFNQILSGTDTMNKEKPSDKGQGTESGKNAVTVISESNVPTPSSPGSKEFGKIPTGSSSTVLSVTVGPKSPRIQEHSTDTKAATNVTSPRSPVSGMSVFSSHGNKSKPPPPALLPKRKATTQLQMPTSPKSPTSPRTPEKMEFTQEYDPVFAKQMKMNNGQQEIVKESINRLKDNPFIRKDGNVKRGRQESFSEKCEMSASSKPRTLSSSLTPKSPKDEHKGAGVTSAQTKEDEVDLNVLDSSSLRSEIIRQSTSRSSARKLSKKTKNVDNIRSKLETPSESSTKKESSSIVNKIISDAAKFEARFSSGSSPNVRDDVLSKADLAHTPLERENPFIQPAEDIIYTRKGSSESCSNKEMSGSVETNVDTEDTATVILTSVQKQDTQSSAEVSAVVQADSINQEGKSTILDADKMTIPELEDKMEPPQRRRKLKVQVPPPTNAKGRETGDVTESPSLALLVSSELEDIGVGEIPGLKTEPDNVPNTTAKEGDINLKSGQQKTGKPPSPKTSQSPSPTTCKSPPPRHKRPLSPKVGKTPPSPRSCKSPSQKLTTPPSPKGGKQKSQSWSTPPSPGGMPLSPRTKQSPLSKAMFGDKESGKSGSEVTGDSRTGRRSYEKTGSSSSRGSSVSSEGSSSPEKGKGARQEVSKSPQKGSQQTPPVVDKAQELGQKSTKKAPPVPEKPKRISSQQKDKPSHLKDTESSASKSKVKSGFSFLKGRKASK
ncbi:uncharacterized protein LOC132543480 [Ylistrum balloti]|uniref:uncharacterized protein LOC132543480 n=1 Tax=Ylistrum balloti TaxID=509963 RepID=UPI002905906B|nr:uncharacterized protein LOC132543480 [Ylistrum balloti]